MLSQKEHQLLLQQRSRLISELLKLNHSNLEAGLSCIVFSKDRAIQLYAMLETYFKFVKDAVPLTIIYHASNEFHEKSYSEVAVLFQKYNGKLKFVREDLSFRESLLAVLAGIRTKNLFFLTDDTIFIREVSLKYASLIDPIHFILTFRHSPHLCYCYTAGVKQKPPSFIHFPNKLKLIKFNWFEQKYHWADPWSVDGHVFSTLEVLILSRISDFKTPNSYESIL
ncbi:hypothetical protein MUO66_09270, partial [Candidatus Bathyarchaeota archaeon]|nr:hypothetical protein [Candidatus Bathyarchaeota archaeon]